MRPDGRPNDSLRPVTITPDYLDAPHGSALIATGRTCVLCTASVEPGAPGWFKTQGRKGGWITAEYAMLPGSTRPRSPRESSGFSGRTQEIRRLIGRSLRLALDLEALDECTVTIDCDVLQADGGTRAASITGGFVALALALERMDDNRMTAGRLIRTPVAAVSSGILGGAAMIDLCYEEDSRAEVDASVVMTGRGEFIECHVAAEAQPFQRHTLDELLALSYKGIGELFQAQRAALETCLNKKLAYFSQF